MQGTLDRRPRLGALRIATIATICLAAGTAHALEVTANYIENSNCDVVAPILTDELGPAASGFPADEAITIISIATNLTPQCVADDGDPSNDFTITMSNDSGIAWKDVTFVADFPLGLGNKDGNVRHPGSSDPSLNGAAFRIDGTVTAGINNPLISESILLDEIFQPGEIWIFTLTNFGTGLPPSFGSVGQFAGSSRNNGDSNASILASPVPEPTTALLLAAGLAGMARARRRPR